MIRTIPRSTNPIIPEVEIIEGWAECCDWEIAINPGNPVRFSIATPAVCESATLTAKQLSSRHAFRQAILEQCHYFTDDGDLDFLFGCRKGKSSEPSAIKLMLAALREHEEEAGK